jgi:hypothetical protein
MSFTQSTTHPVRLLAKTAEHPTKMTSMEKQVFGIQNSGKKFGDGSELLIKVDRSNITNETEIDRLKRLGVWNSLQTNSLYDYLNMTGNVNFSKLEQNLFESIHYELYTFGYNPQLNKPKNKLNIDVRRSETFSLLYNKIFGSSKYYYDYEYSLYTRLARDLNNPKLHE